RLARRGVVVVPGFIGSAQDGSVTTLGRGGSDLTATLLARVLRVSAAVLWKDVRGILTADPRLVPDARVIPHLHHREAAEVAHYGAKVLHPRALSPLTGTKTRLHVRSFLTPEAAGTTVSGRHGPAGFPVKSVAHLGHQAVVAIAGSGLMGVPGTAARAFAAIGAAGVSVSTIFQASSEHSIGFTVPAGDAGRAEDSLRQAFERELQDGRVEGLTVTRGVTVIAVVGDGMAGTPGVAARLFSALAAASVNVMAIAQGSSERNISFVVADADAGTALQQVHAAFALARIGGGRPQPAPVTDVILLGFGRVGRALADQILATGGQQLRVTGVIDRSGYVFDARGVSRTRLAALARGKAGGVPLTRLGGRRATAHDALTEMAAHAMRHAVLVDVTDQPTLHLHRAALAQAFDVVLANKLPLSGPRADYDGLFAAAAAARREIRHEATVGAGLPIIDTFRKLDETGDRIDRIDGCLSGTLMFVLSEVSSGRPFSSAVREAVARGYAEPDPREDLSGRDTARKGVILARLLGYRGPAPRPDDLVPPALRRVPLDAFLRRLPDLDADWHARVSLAATRGRVLRYVVTATPRRVSARLIEVAPDDPLGAAGGTRNIVSFSSHRYRDEPLVIAGPGAGAAVTAAGLLNDIRALHGRRVRAMLD
ncbi:MAG: aspartate kinase, partial [Vicinamibacteria bacterium]